MSKLVLSFFQNLANLVEGIIKFAKLGLLVLVDFFCFLQSLSGNRFVFKRFEIEVAKQVNQFLLYNVDSPIVSNHEVVRGVVCDAHCAEWRHVVLAVESYRLIAMCDAVLLELAVIIKVVVDIHLFDSYICNLSVQFDLPLVLYVLLVC